MAFLSACDSVQKLPERFRLYLHLVRASTGGSPFDSFSGVNASFKRFGFLPLGAVLSFLRRMSLLEFGLVHLSCSKFLFSLLTLGLHEDFIKTSTHLLLYMKSVNYTTGIGKTGLNADSYALGKVHDNL